MYRECVGIRAVNLLPRIRVIGRAVFTTHQTSNAVTTSTRWPFQTAAKPNKENRSVPTQPGGFQRIFRTVKRPLKLNLLIKALSAVEINLF